MVVHTFNPSGGRQISYNIYIMRSRPSIRTKKSSDRQQLRAHICVCDTHTPVPGDLASRQQAKMPIHFLRLNPEFPLLYSLLGSVENFYAKLIATQPQQQWWS